MHGDCWIIHRAIVSLVLARLTGLDAMALSVRALLQAARKLVAR